MSAEQMHFDFGNATDYMHEMLGFEAERDALNERVNEARTLAKEKGVPTKAVELALRQARNRGKALKLVSQEDYDQLVDAAYSMIAIEDATQGLADLGAPPIAAD